MMKPTVTIGLCVRNCETSIKEAISSILNQDFSHERMEVIFVDDGSKDRTLSIILDSIPGMDTQTKVFHGKWKGLGWVRNVVVDNAEGQYIIWVDGDMILPFDHVRKQVVFMQRNPRVGIAKARYGIHPGENLVAALENIVFLAFDFEYAGKANPKVLGTGGSIYRVSAIRHIGGFDSDITGTGEDMDAEYRIRNAGWLLYRATPATFYERCRKTWKDLWSEGFWHGYGVHYIFSKNRGQIVLYRMAPPVAFAVAAWLSTIAYKLTYQRWVFLLPIQYAFKRIAWCFGFAKGQIDGHQPATNNRSTQKKGNSFT